MKKNIKRVLEIIYHDTKNIIKANEVFMSYARNKFVSNDTGSLTDKLLEEIQKDINKAIGYSHSLSLASL